MCSSLTYFLEAEKWQEVVCSRGETTKIKCPKAVDNFIFFVWTSRVEVAVGGGGFCWYLGRDGRLTLPNAPEAAHFTGALIEN